MSITIFSIEIDLLLIAFVALFLGLLYGMYVLKTKTGISFAIRVFIAMVVGGLFGFGSFLALEGESLNTMRNWYSLVGYGFINLLRMIIVPLVPTSIIVSFLRVGDQNLLKKLGFRTIGLFFVTATIASFIGIAVASVMNLGAGVDTSNAKIIDQVSNPETVTSIFEQFSRFIPKSPVANAANLELVPLIVFTLFVAIAAAIEQGRNEERVKPFKNFMESFLIVVTRITKLVLKLTPFGVLALTAYWFSYEKGLNAIPELLLFILAIVIACVIHVLFTYGFGLTFLVNKLNPIKFFRLAAPASILAFTSRSSAGTLTVTIQTLKERLKVSERVSNFVAPLGAVMNMDACGGIYPAVVAIFAANAWGIDLSVNQYILIMVISILASLGTAGVPMGATVFTTIMLQAVGLPLEVFFLVVGVDFIVDMFRTSVNVTGDMVVATTVGKSIGEFDEEAFNKAIV